MGKASRSCGFTLFEILVVVAVIGLLAAIAVPNFVRGRTTAQSKVCINNLRQIDSAIQQWAMDAKAADDAQVLFADISTYLKSSVICPSGGTSFADSYDISSVDETPLCLRFPSDHFLPDTQWKTHGHGHSH